MSLESQLDPNNKTNRNFKIALGTYAVGSLIDFTATYYGMISNEIQELNPLINKSMQLFGTFNGLLIPKVVIGTGLILTSAIYLNEKYKQKKTKFNPSPALCIGGLLTAGAGSSWLIDKYFL